MSRKYQDDSYAIPREGFARWDVGTRVHGYDEGLVILRDAVVTCYAQGGNGDRHWTRMELLFGDGRIHARYWDHRYTRRGMVTLAKRFVEELRAA